MLESAADDLLEVSGSRVEAIRICRRVQSADELVRPGCFGDRSGNHHADGGEGADGICVGTLYEERHREEWDGARGISCDSVGHACCGEADCAGGISDICGEVRTPPTYFLQGCDPREFARA